MSTALEDAGTQLLLCVGYMRILSPAFCRKWAGRCLNVHPSLLPDFAGGMDLQACIWRLLACVGNRSLLAAARVCYIFRAQKCCSSPMMLSICAGCSAFRRGLHHDALSHQDGM